MNNILLTNQQTCQSTQYDSFDTKFFEFQFSSTAPIKAAVEEVLFSVEYSSDGNYVIADSDFIKQYTIPDEENGGQIYINYKDIRVNGTSYKKLLDIYDTYICYGAVENQQYLALLYKRNIQLISYDGQQDSQNYRFDYKMELLKILPNFSYIIVRGEDQVHRFYDMSNLADFTEEAGLFQALRASFSGFTYTDLDTASTETAIPINYFFSRDSNTVYFMDQLNIWTFDISDKSLWVDENYVVTSTQLTHLVKRTSDFIPKQCEFTDDGNYYYLLSDDKKLEIRQTSDFQIVAQSTLQQISKFGFLRQTGMLVVFLGDFGYNILNTVYKDEWNTAAPFELPVVQTVAVDLLDRGIAHPDGTIIQTISTVETSFQVFVNSQPFHEFEVIRDLPPSVAYSNNAALESVEDWSMTKILPFGSDYLVVANHNLLQILQKQPDNTYNLMSSYTPPEYTRIAPFELAFKDSDHIIYTPGPVYFLRINSSNPTSITAVAKIPYEEDGSRSYVFSTDYNYFFQANKVYILAGPTGWSSEQVLTAQYTHIDLGEVIAQHDRYLVTSTGVYDIIEISRLTDPDIESRKISQFPEVNQVVQCQFIEENTVLLALFADRTIKFVNFGTFLIYEGQDIEDVSLLPVQQAEYQPTFLPTNFHYDCRTKILYTMNKNQLALFYMANYQQTLLDPNLELEPFKIIDIDGITTGFFNDFTQQYTFATMDFEVKIIQHDQMTLYHKMSNVQAMNKKAFQIEYGIYDKTTLDFDYQTEFRIFEFLLVQDQKRNPLPTWIEFQKLSNLVIIYADNTDYLQFLTNLYYRYSLKADQAHLDGLEAGLTQKLITGQYLDSDLFLTPQFDPNGSLAIDTAADVSVIMDYLRSIQVTNEYVMPVQRYIGSNLPPFVQFPINDQYTNHSDPFKVGRFAQFAINGATFYDYNGDPLTYFLIEKPDWLGFDQNSLTFQGEPALEDLGFHQVKLMVTDQFSSVKETFRFEVFNVQPTITDVATELDYILGTTFSYEMSNTSFNDVDRDFLTITASYSDTENGTFLDSSPWLVFNTNLLFFTGVLANFQNDIPLQEDGYAAETYILVTCTDPGLLFATHKIKINMENKKPYINYPPNLPDLFLQFGAGSLNFYVPQGMFVDPENLTINYKAYYKIITAGVEGAENEILGGFWIQFEPLSRRLFGTPQTSDIAELPTGYFQEYTIRIEAIDNVGMKIDTSFKFTVQNLKPVIDPSAEFITEQFATIGSTYTYFFQKNIINDADDNSLVYTAFHKPEGTGDDQYVLLDVDPNVFWLTFIAADLQITGTPQISDSIQTPEGYKSVLDIKIVGTDSIGQFQERFYTLSVQNLAPVLNTFIFIDPQTLILGDEYVYNVSRNLFNDPEDEAMTYVVELIPINPDTGAEETPIVLGENINAFWLTFNQLSLKIQGTPTINDITTNDEGYYQQFKIKITVEDNIGQQNSVSFDLEVSNVAPVVSNAIEEQTHVMGSVFNLVLPKDLFLDPDEVALQINVYIMENGSPRALLNDNSFWLQYNPQQKMIYGDPGANDIAQDDDGFYEEFQIRITAEDSLGQTIQAEFQLNVQNIKPYVNSRIVLSDDTIILPQTYLKKIPESQFIDPDEYNIQYLVEIIDPDTEIAIREVNTSADNDFWMKFNPNTLNIYGDATADDIAQIETGYFEVYTIRITVTDSYQQSTFVTFQLTVQNDFPRANPHKTMENDKVIIGYDYSRLVPVDLFLNYDDILEYNVYYQEGDQEIQLIATGDYWLRYYPDQMELYGKPKLEDAELLPDGKYYKEFIIIVRGTDTLDQTIEATFSLIITVENPDFNAEGMEDFLQQDQTGGQNYEFRMPNGIFVDSNNTELFYTAFYSEDNWATGTEILESNPHWLKFNPQRVIVYGKPGKNDMNAVENGYEITLQIRIVAANKIGLQMSVDYQLYIKNEKPEVLKTAQSQITKKYDYKSDIEIQFVKNTFTDPDLDELTYELMTLDESKLPDHIVFIEEQLKFKAKFSSIDKFQYKIRATDIMGNYVDTIFEIETQPNFLYYLEYVLIYSGPVISVLGLFKYTPQLYNILCKKKYKYKRPFVVRVFENFDLCIPFILDELKAKKDEQPELIKEFLLVNQELKEKENKPTLKFYENLKKKCLVIPEKIDKEQEIETIADEQETLKNNTKKDPKKKQKISRKDWYREFCDIEEAKMDEVIFQNQPEQIKFNQNFSEIVDEILKSDKCQISKDQINFDLLEKKLKADICGIYGTQFKTFSQGQSLHVNSIKKINCEMLKKVKKQPLQKFMGYFNLDYKQKTEHNDNKQFPEWFNYQVEENCIKVFGAPKAKDVGPVKIILRNEDGYILREFIIEVVSSEEKEITVADSEKYRKNMNKVVPINSDFQKQQGGEKKSPSSGGPLVGKQDTDWLDVLSDTQGKEKSSGNNEKEQEVDLQELEDLISDSKLLPKPEKDQQKNSKKDINLISIDKKIKNNDKDHIKLDIDQDIDDIISDIRLEEKDETNRKNSISKTPNNKQDLDKKQNNNNNQRLSKFGIQNSQENNKDIKKPEEQKKDINNDKINNKQEKEIKKPEQQKNINNDKINNKQDKDFKKPEQQQKQQEKPSKNQKPIQNPEDSKQQVKKPEQQKPDNSNNKNQEKIEDKNNKIPKQQQEKKSNKHSENEKIKNDENNNKNKQDDRKKPENNDDKNKKQQVAIDIENKKEVSKEQQSKKSEFNLDNKKEEKI